jgi:hypothetical protein
MTSRLIGLFLSAVALTVRAKPAAGQALPRASDGKPNYTHDSLVLVVLAALLAARTGGFSRDGVRWSHPHKRAAE